MRAPPTFLVLTAVLPFSALFAACGEGDGRARDGRDPGPDAASGQDGATDAQSHGDAGRDPGVDAGRDASLGTSDASSLGCGELTRAALPPVVAAEGRITFPTPCARSESETTLVVGCVERPREVTSVELAGARLSLDEQGCFREQTPTPYGTTLVELTVARGAEAAVAARVALVRAVAPTFLGAQAIDPEGQRLFVVHSMRAERSLVELQVSGKMARTIGEFRSATALAYDAEKDRLLGIDRGSLIAVDARSGAEIVRALDLPSTFPAGAVAFDSEARVLYAVFQASVIAVDVDEPSARVVRQGSDNENVLEALAFSANARELYALRAGFGAQVLGLDIASGKERVVVKEGSESLGSLAVLGDRLWMSDLGVLRAFTLPSGAPVALSDATRTWFGPLLASRTGLFALGARGIYSVNANTGAATRVRDFGFPRAGEPLSEAAHFVVDETNEQLFVASGSDVFAFDLQTATARTLLDGPPTESEAPSLVDRHRASGDLFLILASDPSRLLRMPAMGGAPREVANLATELAGQAPRALVAQGAFAYVAVGRSDELVRIDLQSGTLQKLKVELGLGDAPSVSDLASDDQGRTLFVVEEGGEVGIYDYESFRQIARRPTTPNTNQASLAYDPLRAELWVLDNNNSTGFEVLAVDASAPNRHVAALRSNIRHVPLQSYRGHLLSFDGASIGMQDARAEQWVEVWRPD